MDSVLNSAPAGRNSAYCLPLPTLPPPRRLPYPSCGKHGHGDTIGKGGSFADHSTQPRRCKEAGGPLGSKVWFVAGWFSLSGEATSRSENNGQGTTISTTRMTRSLIAKRFKAKMKTRAVFFHRSFFTNTCYLAVYRSRCCYTACLPSVGVAQGVVKNTLREIVSFTNMENNIYFGCKAAKQIFSSRSKCIQIDGQRRTARLVFATSYEISTI